MSDQGDVSTEDTLEPRNQMVVTTEENAEPPADGESQTRDEPAPSADDTQPKPPTRNRRAERRIKTLQKKLSASEEARAEDLKRLAELEQTVEQLKAKKPEAPEPQLSDFETAAEFGEAYASWKATQAEPEPAPPKADPKPKAEPEPTQDPFEDERKRLMESGLEKYGDDFAAAMSPDENLPVNLDMRDFIFESDVGAEIIMYLDDNRAEAEKIYYQGPAAAQKAMEKIEAKVKETPPDRDGEIRAAEAPDGGDEPSRRTSQPEPPETVRTNAAPTTKPLVDMSMDEYAEKRLQDEKKRRVM